MPNKQDENYIFSTDKSGLLVSWLLSIILSLISYPIITKGFSQADNTGLVLMLSIFPLLAILFTYLV